MRNVAIVLAVILAVTTCEAGAKWKEVRKPKNPPSEAVTRGNLDCSSAIPIAVGETIWSSNVGEPANVDSFPACVSDWSEEGGEAVFELTIDGPSCRDIGISLWYRPDICDLDWFLLGSCDEGDCVEFDDYSYHVDCLDPGTYYLVVDGYEGDECEFVIAVYHNEPVTECSPLLSICHKWDFNASDQGFVHEACGVSKSVWEWGAAFDIPDTACGGTPVVNVLSTGLSGSYPEDAADAAYVGPVLIGEDCSCLALCHFYEIEEGYDGGMVGLTTDGGTTWSLLTPARGYDEIGDWNDTCIGPFPCFSSESFDEFVTDTFDISPWIGETVSIGFFFGSDGSVEYDGWSILWAAIGTSESPVEHSSWGAIKALYR